MAASLGLALGGCGAKDKKTATSSAKASTSKVEKKAKSNSKKSAASSAQAKDTASSSTQASSATASKDSGKTENASTTTQASKMIANRLGQRPIQQEQSKQQAISIIGMLKALMGLMLCFLGSQG